MQATAPVRSATPRLGVHQVVKQEGSKFKWWICPSSDHWVDQCHTFTAMSPNDRLKKVKENHACFSCLKRAGRGHRAANCSRRHLCTELVNNSPFPQEPPSFAARSEWQSYWYVGLYNEEEGCNTSSCYSFCCWKKWETGGSEHSNGFGCANQFGKK